MAVNELYNVVGHKILPRPARNTMPLGLFSAVGQVSGNASGGWALLGFQIPGNRRQDYVWSWQATWLSVANAETDPGPVAIVYHLLQIPPGVTTPVQLHLGVNLVEVPSGAWYPDRPIPPVEWQRLFVFDDQPGNTPVDVDLVQLSFANNIDGATYTARIFGYFWDRAVMTSGPREYL